MDVTKSPRLEFERNFIHPFMPASLENFVLFTFFLCLACLKMIKMGITHAITAKFLRGGNGWTLLLDSMRPSIIGSRFFAHGKGTYHWPHSNLAFL